KMCTSLASYIFPTRRSSDLALVDQDVDAHPGGERGEDDDRDELLEVLLDRALHRFKPPRRLSVRLRNVSIGGLTCTCAFGGCTGDRKSTRLNSSHVSNSYAV